MGFAKWLKNALHRIVPAPVRPIVRRGFNRVRHYGWTCYCPVCKAHIRAFLPHASCDGSIRPGAECPVCGVCERHRQFWMFLEDFRILDGGPKTVVHVAPEVPLRQRFLGMAEVTYISGAIQPGMGLPKLDLTNIELPSDSVDLLYASHVLNMIPDERAAMREVFRVMRAPGIAVLQVPVFRQTSVDYRGHDESECERIFKAPGMHHVFGIDILDRFREAGFELAIVPYATLMSDFTRKRFGLEKQDMIVCIKR